MYAGELIGFGVDPGESGRGSERGEVLSAVVNGVRHRWEVVLTRLQMLQLHSAMVSGYVSSSGEVSLMAAWTAPQWQVPWW